MLRAAWARLSGHYAVARPYLGLIRDLGRMTSRFQRRSDRTHASHLFRLVTRPV